MMQESLVGSGWESFRGILNRAYDRESCACDNHLQYKPVAKVEMPSCKPSIQNVGS